MTNAASDSWMKLTTSMGPTILTTLNTYCMSQCFLTHLQLLIDLQWDRVGLCSECPATNIYCIFDAPGAFAPKMTW